MLSPSAIQALEAKMTDFERSGSTQVVVLTIPTLGGENLEEYSIKVAEAWRVGQKKIDNGVILLVAKQERKIRIEVGRGLEGKLTDLVSGRIIHDQISPHFKAGDFDGGVVAGVSAIMDVVKGEYTAQPRDLRQSKRSAPPIFTLGIFLISPAFSWAHSPGRGWHSWSRGLADHYIPRFSRPGCDHSCRYCVAGSSWDCSFLSCSAAEQAGEAVEDPLSAAVGEADLPVAAVAGFPAAAVTSAVAGLRETGRKCVWWVRARPGVTMEIPDRFSAKMNVNKSGGVWQQPKPRLPAK